MEKNKITIPINQKTFLVYRVTNISKSVLLVRKQNKIPGECLDWDDTEQCLLATSSVGCAALAEGLEQMAKEIRKLKE